MIENIAQKKTKKNKGVAVQHYFGHLMRRANSWEKDLDAEKD